MTEVVTPSGKGRVPVGRLLQQRFVLEFSCFAGQRIDYMRLRVVMGMDETPGYGPHVDEGVDVY
jgi:hypothetical protein